MVQINRYLGNKHFTTVLLIFIPLALSAFTHLWNPIGFPTFHVDEGHYMRRAMQVLEGLGPQETKDTYDYGYDHPYFGQIFLASALSLVNYPHSLHPSVNLHSIEMLYLVPRVLMGILAIADTFLVYKIAETRYGRNVAFISATLFAVMPLSRILRGILLDSIQLPFILTSILFAVYYAKSEAHYTNASSSNKKILLILLSGIFLGLAIFTKVPVFTMIPLVAYIILKKDKDKDKDKNDTGHAMAKTRSSLKYLAMWFVPVILIPMIWPAYAVSMGQIGEWIDGVLYQTQRDTTRDLRFSILLVGQIDPVILILGASGVIYAVIKKDYFILLWAFPYLIFLYLVGWVVYFHWSVLLPLLCIAIGVLVQDLRNTIRYRKYVGLLPYGMISAIAIFGILSTATMAASNLNLEYLKVNAFVAGELHQNGPDHNQEQDSDNAISLIGSHRTRALIWIPKYVFNDNVIFRDTELPNDNFTKPVQTKKFIIVADSILFSRFNEVKQLEKYNRITKLYYNSSESIATFIDMESNKYDFLNVRENHGFGPFVEVRANY